MIRTKAKGLLLSFMLIVACCVFFACKQETKVQVDSIYFTEQEISLLVGEEYSPTIKILPSYSTNRGYTLISNDVTALKVEGGTITALKAGMDIKLKVVSDDNQNANDVISVNIYEEATQLETPTGLNFNGSKFTFVGKDNANSYILKIGEEEINIGNNTEYSFTSLANRIDNAYNKVITCSVKAIGDGKVFKDSNYSTQIQFVKLSKVENAYIQNETLYFSGIENVASYNVETLTNGKIIKTQIVNNATLNEKQLNLDLSALTDSENGAEYLLRITPNAEGYKGTEQSNVFIDSMLELDYAVIGRVKNTTINNGIISWDFVKNALNYTVDLYKGGKILQQFVNVTTNFITMPYEDEGEYYCKILANSDNDNTTTGKEYSQPLHFTILQAPTIVANNNIVSWNKINNAEGYLVTIKDKDGAIITNKTFVLSASYDVSAFVAGEYSIEVVACGNGENGQEEEAILSSKTSNLLSWIILSDLQVKIQDGKLQWQDLDANSLNQYRIQFGTVDIVLTDEDYGNQYSYDSQTNTFSYDLSNYNFDAGSYDVSIKSIGSKNIFDAQANNTNFIKLNNGSISSMANKQFTITPVDNANDYKIAIYSATDMDTAIMTLDTMQSGYKFSLDDTSLDAGKYVAKVFVYGNGINIFDADNSNEGTTINFEKLSSPTISADGVNLKVVLSEIANATTYKLFENSNIKTINNREYSLSNLTAGDYVYSAQAIGNGTTVLDSAVTISENQIKIKKLTNPGLTFNKNSLTFEVSCSDQDYVNSYIFSLNDQNVTVANFVADCSNIITDSGTYEAKVYAKAKTIGAGYNLIMDSGTKSYSVSKLNALCDFQISNGNLIVVPSETLTGSGYNLSLRIENGASDIILEDFIYTNSHFEMNLYDSKYNPIDKITNLFKSAGNYELFATISQDNANVVTSSETKSLNSLSVLGKVSTISKNGQSIEFNSVDKATNYIAIISVEGKEYYVDIAEKFTNATKNLLPMENLLRLMTTMNISYLEQTPYTISFVAVNNDIHTMPNKGVNNYTFKYLKAPILSVVEQENNTKLLSIVSDDSNISSYNVVISQDMVVCETSITKTNNTLINMDDLTQLIAGNVEADIYSVANSGNYFNSKHAVLNMVKLNAPKVNIANGVLTWDAIVGAKQYNLTYSNITGSGTMILQEGIDNFTISNNKCTYDFTSLQNGVSSIFLQVDSEAQVGNNYYLNSNEGEVFDNVYKLSSLQIKVVNGQIYTEIRNTEIQYIQQIELKVNDRVINRDITQSQYGITLTSVGDKVCITIMPEILLTYGSTKLLLETLSIKTYSNNATTLNSSVSKKDIYGLLSPTELDITTSKNANELGVINEILEKITWNNPPANNNHVVKYEITINHNSNIYIFNSDKRAFMMPTYYDKNNNGIKDDGDVEFGAGVYTIKVKALTDDCNNIVNSKYCEEISVTVLETPTNLSIQEGNVIWDNDETVGYYLLKVYLLNGEEKSLIVSSQAAINELDLTTLNPFTTGVYGISVQAMHDNTRVLASKESEILQVIRLPQVETYFVKDGEFYINMHSFYTKAEIYLTNTSNNSDTYTFTLENPDLTAYTTYISDENFIGWKDSNIIDTYQNEDYIISVKYQNEDDSTLRTALAAGYTVKVKLFGNTATEGAIISGQISQPINKYYEEDDEVSDKNALEKLITPTVEISSTERGIVLVNIPNGLSYTLNYYVDGDKSLQGVHLYQVNIETNEQYTIYVAEIVNQSLLEESLAAVGSELITDNVDRNYLKHFTYNEITFNVIDENAQGYIPFDFNDNYYYYYTLGGEYEYIDLTVGGSLVTSVRFMGDDSMFTKSNLTDSVTIKRYNSLNLTINNGILTWLNQATVEDHPIYIITLTNEGETYELVLYNPNVEYEEGKKYNEEYLLSCLDSDKTYIFDTISYVLNENIDDDVITYDGLADIINLTRINNSSELIGLGGTFMATIKAHYTNNTSMDIILAQGGESKTVSILPQSQISVVDGSLSWNMSYVTSTGGKEYISNYLLQLFNGDRELYEIILKSGDYSVVNHVATYELPQILSNGEDGEFRIQPNSSYIFKLIALGAEGKTYINSITSTTDSIKILPNLQNVKMSNGVLTWNNSTSNSVEVQITYTLGDSVVTFITVETDNVFDLPASYTDTSQTLRQLIAGYDYHIKVRLRGQANTLNGFFSNEIVAQRLSTISSDSITTNNGVLTWKADALQGAKYTILYTLANGQTGETEMITTNSYSFEGFPAGAITVKVFAHHNNHFSAFESEATTVFKLTVPSNINYHEGETTISWDKIVDAEGNPVDTYMVSLKQAGMATAEYRCSTNEWKITGLSTNSFSIAVKAIDTNSKGYIINSDYSTYHTMELPNQVDGTTFVFDEDIKAFKWKAVDGEQEGDKYYIGYNYYDTILNSGSSAQPTKVDYIEVSTSRVVNGETYYYFYPTMIGSYRLIYVQVVRAGSLSSQETYCMNGNSYYELDLDLFTSGEGTADKPYIISNERHLRNIKLFLDANYELDTNIVLTSNEAITDSTQVFTGTINGNGYYISGVPNTNPIIFSESGYVGLFSKARGASFVNITLSNFSLNGYLNSATLYMGILVGYAEEEINAEGEVTSTIFKNITITSSTIKLAKDSEIGYTNNSVDMYVGIIAGYASNCEFTGCIINLGGSEANIIADIEGNSQTKLAIGGIAGFADKCKLSGNTSNAGNAFILSTILTVTGGTPVQYVGALIGEVGEQGATIINNSCVYAEATSQGLTSKDTQIGYEN